MMPVNKIDIKKMQAICIAKLVMACMTIMGINKRNTMRIVTHRCAVICSACPSIKKICLL